MPIHPASAVVLLRNPPSPDVYWVRRADDQAFLPGFHAFPGGRVTSEDDAVPVEGAEGEAARSRAAAVRECFEESGVLVARGAERLAPQELAEARRAILAGALSFAEFCKRAGLRLDAGDLAECGRWITPEFSPRRFEALYYLSWLPEGQHASVIPGELSEGGWVRPREALIAWRNGRIFMAPPVLRSLEGLAAAAAEGGQAEKFLAQLRAASGSTGPIEMTQGIRLVPLRAATLPPATHTNCYIVGDDPLAVFDPGSTEPEAAVALAKILDPLVAEGRRVEGIYVTHHHADHWAGAAALRERFGAPIHAHPDSPRDVPADRALEDGQAIALGSRRLRAVFTPGHAADHVAFFDERSGVLLAGDVATGVGTVVVDPPDGDMSAYFATLDRLLHLPIAAIFPGHGPPMAGARSRLAALKRHRQEREERVIAALGRDPASAKSLLPTVYDDVPASALALAERSLLAHLIKLEREGRARRQDGGWTCVTEVSFG